MFLVCTDSSHWPFNFPQIERGHPSLRLHHLNQGFEDDAQARFKLRVLCNSFEVQCSDLEFEELPEVVLST